MVEEALPRVAPNLPLSAIPNNFPQTAEKTQAASKKSTTARTAAKPADRRQRLQVHLWIGFLMVSLTVLGYVFFGAEAKVDAADAANHQLVNVSPTGAYSDQYLGQMQLADVPDSAYTGNLAAMQAEMAEITQQLTALKAGMYTVHMPQPPNQDQLTSAERNHAGSANLHNTAGHSANEAQAKLEQMMEITHDMMAKMDRLKQSPSDSRIGGHH
jgi:hypothetical protein